MCRALIYLGGVLHSEGKVQTRKKPQNVSQLEKKETRVLLWKNTLLKLPLCSESLLEFCFKGKMFKSREMRRSAQVWVVCWTPYGNTHTVQLRREVRGGKNFSVKVGSSKKGLVLVFCWTCWTLDDRTHWYPSLKLYRSWILYIFNWDQHSAG